MTKTRRRNVLNLIVIAFLFSLTVVLSVGCRKNFDTHEVHGVQMSNQEQQYTPSISPEDYSFVNYYEKLSFSNNDIYEFVPWDDGKLYFGNGRWGVEIVSENIIAFYDIFHSYIHTRFGLTPLEHEFPKGNVDPVILPPVILFDWSDYQHRLSEVSYHITMNETLVNEAPTILHRILYLDGVVHAPDSLFYDFIPITRPQWINNEVFQQFIYENVTIDFVESDAADGDTLTSNLTWQVFWGSCLINYDLIPLDYVCYQHVFEIWLVDFSDDSRRIVWDTKSIVEAGCGRTLCFS